MLAISKLIALAFAASFVSGQSVQTEDSSSTTGGTETTEPTVSSWDAPTWNGERRPREYERWDGNKWDDGKELRSKKWDGKEQKWDGQETRWDGNQWEGKTNRWNENDGEKEYDPRETWQARPRKYGSWGRQNEGVWDDGKEATRWDGNRWDDGRWDGQRNEWNDAQKWGEQKWDGNRWEEKPRTWEKETSWQPSSWQSTSWDREPRWDGKVTNWDGLNRWNHNKWVERKTGKAKAAPLTDDVFAKTILNSDIWV